VSQSSDNPPIRIGDVREMLRSLNTPEARRRQQEQIDAGFERIYRVLLEMRLVEALKRVYRRKLREGSVS
jgi:hypothetical protein